MSDGSGKNGKSHNSDNDKYVSGPVNTDTKPTDSLDPDNSANRHLLHQSSIEQMPENLVQHQFNDNALRHTRTLSNTTGLQRIGVHQVRIEPGCESTTHHFHDTDEEFIYIISGSGKAKIGDREYDISAGDFMGFPQASPAHSMRNTGSEDLIYLMGGERNASDVVHYPELKRSLIKSNGKRLWSDWQDMHELPPR